MNNEHSYAVTVTWTGNRGTGTSDYRAYGRDHVVRADGKVHDIEGSSDRAFRGDAERWNPEDLLLSALSQCFMLSYLHVAVQNGIVVTDYVDDAVGSMELSGDGGGRFTTATLRPRITIASGDPEVARSICERAAALCFIASSVDFPVHHEPQIIAV